MTNVEQSLKIIHEKTDVDMSSYNSDEIIKFIFKLTDSFAIECVGNIYEHVYKEICVTFIPRGKIWHNDTGEFSMVHMIHFDNVEEFSFKSFLLKSLAAYLSKN